MLELLADSLLVAMGQTPFRKAEARTEDRSRITDGSRHRWMQRGATQRQD